MEMMQRNPGAPRQGPQQGGTDTKGRARSMRVDELKARVKDDAYVVDPRLVAEALLRHDAPLRALALPISRRGARGRSAPPPPRRPS
jgi:hypothetical protein